MQHQSINLVIEHISTFLDSIQNNTSIICLYHYGSVVYSTTSNQSDIDYICIVDSDNDEFNGKSIKFNLNNQYHDVQFYTKNKFQELVQQHAIMALESIFLPQCHKLIELHQFSFELNLSQLRKSISATSSNSWVKCFKKIEIENEPYIGLKSLFHSLRIISFGIDIAQQQSIKFTEHTDRYLEIMSLLNTDNCNKLIIKQKYQQLYNQLSSTFKQLAPKEA